jgi:hypothetical protein
VCRKLEARGTIETAHRVKAACGQVFRYAIATGRATYEPTQALKGALQARYEPRTMPPLLTLASCPTDARYTRLSRALHRCLCA